MKIKNNSKLKVGDLRVWWVPQVPMKAFYVDVETPQEAKKILDVLAHYDIFQYENNVKPDFANAGGLSVWETDGEGEFDWFDWTDSDGEDIDHTETFEYHA